MAATVSSAGVAPTAVDPFGYWPDLASRIEGLGGAHSPPDPNYVFHSSYLACEAGRNRLTLTFTALQASAGELTVRIFSYAEARHDKIREDAAMRVNLREAAATRRPFSLSFEVEDGHQYAFAGYVFGVATASAKALALAVAPAGDHDDDDGIEPSRFGRKRARRMFALKSSERPLIAYPVSQAYTPEQTVEPEFERWITPLPSPPATAEEQWEVAYVLQCLAIYGRLERGVRALGFARADDPIVGVLRARGCSVTLVEPDYGPGVDDRLAAAVVPDDEEQGPAFDVVWSRRGGEDTFAEADARTFFEKLIDFTAPGGLAVHTLAMPSTEPLHRDAPLPGVDRNGLQRLALEIVAQGHIVGQLKLPPRGTGDRPDITVPFGIIIRKSAPVLATVVVEEMEAA